MWLGEGVRKFSKFVLYNLNCILYCILAKYGVSRKRRDGNITRENMTRYIGFQALHDGEVSI